MKVHLRGRPKLFSLTKVTCQDARMIEMINCTPDAQYFLDPDALKRHRLTPTVPFYVFMNGSVLSTGAAKNQFFIECRREDGSDVLSAIEELKMLDYLRLARQHFQEMKAVCYNPKLNEFSLRVTRC